MKAKIKKSIFGTRFVKILMLTNWDDGNILFENMDDIHLNRMVKSKNSEDLGRAKVR